MQPAPISERRRSIRFIPSDLKGTIQLGNQKIPLSIFDMSTLGIGIELMTPPQGTNIHISFDAPAQLKGLEIDAQQRRVIKSRTSDGKDCFHIGYEFIFLSFTQQQKLNAWATEYLLTHQAEDLDKKSRITHPFLSMHNASGLMQQWDVRFPQKKEEFEQCLELIIPLQIQHALIQTKFLMATERDKMASLMVFIPDLVDFKLPADLHAPAAINSLRTEGKTLAQVTVPFFNEKVQKIKNPSASQMLRLQILFSLFPHALIYAAHFAHVTDLIVITPSNMEEFYRMWLFDRIIVTDDPVQTSPEIRSQIYTPMVLNIEKFFDVAEKERPDLFQITQNISKSKSVEKKYKETYYPEHDVLKSWFYEQNKILTNLTSAQEEYFRFLSPDIRS